MANEMNRVAIEFKADGTVNFQKSLKEVNQSINENRSAFRLARSEWDENTTALERLRTQQEYLQNQTDAYTEKVRQLEDILNQLESAENRNEAAISRTREQLNNARSTLNNYQRGLEEVTEEINSGNAELEEMANKVQKVADKMTAAGGAITKGLTAPIAALGVASGAAWKELDEAYDGIAAGTGAVGEALDDLQNSFDNVYGSFQADSASTSIAIADINTRFGFTGDTLEKCAIKFLKFAEVNNTDVSTAIEKVSRHMGDAGLDASEYSTVLDALTAASQGSGIAVDTLAENLTKYGAPMRALGFTTQESIALFAQWEKVGVNTEIAFSGMKKSISNWTAEGKDAKEEFKKMLAEIEAAPNIASATTKAIEVFGAKAGPDLADAIQGGRFSIESFLQVVESSEGQLDATFDAMQDAPDKATIALNNLKLAGADLTDVALTSLAPTLEDIVELVKEFTGWFQNLDEDTKEMIIKVALLAASIGPVIMVMGKMAGGISSIITLMTKLGPILTAAKTGIASVNAVLAANPIFLVIAAIVAIIASIVYLYNTCDWFREGVNDIGEWIKNLFIKEIPEAAQTVVDFVKDNWQGLLLLLVNPFAGAFKLLYDNCGAFREFIDVWVEKISKPFKNLGKNFKEAIGKLADSWENLKSKIKMPHFDIKGSFSINPPSVPTLDVEWYAKGAILNRPTAFGMNGNSVMVGGEAGPEAVLPISNLLEYMRIANSESNTELANILLSMLPQLVASAISQMPIEVLVQLGNKKLAKEMVDIVISKLNKQNNSYMTFKGGMA